MESTPAGSGHKVVIIGVGGIARVYAQALAQIPDATLVAGAPPPHARPTPLRAVPTAGG